MFLRNYGGGHLDIMAQLLVHISKGEYHTDVTVLVRKDAPNRLLLGTDGQLLLGYVLIKKENEERCKCHNVTTGSTVRLDDKSTMTPPEPDKA